MLCDGEKRDGDGRVLDGGSDGVRDGCDESRVGDGDGWSETSESDGIDGDGVIEVATAIITDAIGRWVNGRVAGERRRQGDVVQW